MFVIQQLLEDLRVVLSGVRRGGTLVRMLVIVDSPWHVAIMGAVVRQ